MNQTKKAKGYVVEVFHAHQNALDSRIYPTIEDALKVLDSDPQAGKIYEIHSKHSSSVDGYAVLWAEDNLSPLVYKEEIDADEARTAYLHSHPNLKDPGKVVALKAVEC